MISRGGGRGVSHRVLDVTVWHKSVPDHKSVVDLEGSRVKGTTPPAPLAMLKLVKKMASVHRRKCHKSCAPPPPLDKFLVPFVINVAAPLLVVAACGIDEGLKRHVTYSTTPTKLHVFWYTILNIVNSDVIPFVTIHTETAWCIIYNTDHRK